MRSIPIILTTILIIGIFARIVLGTQLDDIRSNWDTRRCEGLVVAIAHLVPDGKDPTLDTTEFATNNLYFCMNKLVDDSMKTAMFPVMKLYGSIFDSSSSVGKSINYLRANAASLTSIFTSYVQGLWNRMKILSTKMHIITFSFRMMFQRIQTIILSILFSGISALYGIINLLRLIFVIFIIIIAIITSVLIILSILSFYMPGVFALIALLTNILFTITAIVLLIAVTVLGAKTGII